jgi:hypothetical protein
MNSILIPWRRRLGAQPGTAIRSNCNSASRMLVTMKRAWSAPVPGCCELLLSSPRAPFMAALSLNIAAPEDGRTPVQGGRARIGFRGNLTPAFLNMMWVGTSHCDVPVAERSVRRRNRTSRAARLSQHPLTLRLGVWTAQRAVPTRFRDSKRGLGEDKFRVASNCSLPPGEPIHD